MEAAIRPAVEDELKVLFATAATVQGWYKEWIARAGEPEAGKEDQSELPITGAFMQPHAPYKVAVGPMSSPMRDAFVQMVGASGGRACVVISDAVQRDPDGLVNVLAMALVTMYFLPDGSMQIEMEKYSWEDGELVWGEVIKVPSAPIDPQSRYYGKWNPKWEESNNGEVAQAD